MMKIPEDVLETLESPSSIKMIGTVDSENNINVDPVEMVKAVGKDIIAFACYHLKGKAVENIKKNRRTSLAIFEPDMIGFQLKGVFEEIVERGELFDHFKKVNDESKPACVVTFRVTEIYALTMALAGERLA